MDFYSTYIVVYIGEYENYPFIRHHEPILLVSMHEVCVYIGPYDHILTTILTLRHPPYKSHNTHSSPWKHRQHTYRVIGAIEKTEQDYNIGDKTSLLLESRTPNHA